MNQAWLKAAKQGDVAAMKALADYLEEQGDKLGAATWRGKAGLSRVVYQVVNTETGEVEKEYKAMPPCEQWVRQYSHEADRRARIVRVMEFIERPVVELKPELKSAWDGKGPVEVRFGEFAGKSGEAIGFARGSTERYRIFQVVIDGVQHEMAAGYLEFLR